MNRGTILLRVDGSAKGGMGRLARSLALANALQRRRYQMTFISQLDSPSWPDRIRRFRHAIVKTSHTAGSEEDRSEFFREIAQRNPVIVVTDSPNIDEEYLAMLSNRVPLVISLDDSAQTRFPSDLVLSPSLTSGVEDYSVYKGTQVLAGNKYAMVRAEFRRARNVRATEPGGPARVLVALGGGDRADESITLTKALLDVAKIERVDICVGHGNSQADKLQQLVSQSEGRVGVAVDCRDLGIKMTKAHLLITGGGNTALEGACVGIPMLSIARDDLQETNANRLEEAGATQYLGRFNAVKPKAVVEAAISVLEDNFERKAMSRSGRLLIDGRGADRMVTAAEILLRRSKKVKAIAA